MSIDKTNTNVVDQLIDAFGNEPETCSVEFNNGVKITFRHLTDLAEIRALYKKAQKFAKQHVSGGALASKDWKEVATSDEELATGAYLVGAVSLEPKFTTLDVFRLMKKAPKVYLEMSRVVSESINSDRIKAEIEELDEMGEDSEPIQS